jgi:hypothetical protein
METNTKNLSFCKTQQEWQEVSDALPDLVVGEFMGREEKLLVDWVACLFTGVYFGRCYVLHRGF